MTAPIQKFCARVLMVCITRRLLESDQQEVRCFDNVVAVQHLLLDANQQQQVGTELPDYPKVFNNRI